MRKLASVTLVVLALLLLSAGQSDAWSRGWHHGGPRVVVGFGGWWGPPYWYYPPPYYVYGPPQVVVQEPPVYVQQTPAPAPPAPPAPPSAAQQTYWYYCAPTKDYYPNVQTCSEAWIKVAPRQD